MRSPSAKTPQTLERMSGTFERLAAQLHELGLCLSVWDQDGRRACPFRPASDLCRAFAASDRWSDEPLRGVALQVLERDAPVTARTPCGCCAIGLPVRHRRRLAGAAVACFPPRELLDEETLARLCDRLHLDREVVWDYARKACHLRAEFTDYLLKVLEQLLEAEHASQVSADELGTLSTNLATTYEELSLLYRISGSMRVTQRPREFIQDVCNELLEVMDVQVTAAVVRAHAPANARDIVVHAGRTMLDNAHVKTLAERQVLPRFGQEKRIVLDNRFGYSAGGEAIRNVVAVPLVHENRVIGAMFALNKHDGEFDSVDVKLINSIANQVAGFLANHWLYADLQDLLLGVLHALTATIDAKDPYTCGHSQRVALISKRLAGEMGFPPEKVQRVYLSGLLHDIGKIGIPESTLRKEGRLTDEEYDDMKRHPAVGAKILEGIRQLDGVIVGILHHHERPDGRGYPAGLSGGEISIEGRIVCLADCFDAMTSNRTYRGSLPLETVTAEIREHAGTQFDAQLVELLLSLDLEELLEEIHQPVQDFYPLVFSQDRTP